MKKIILLATMLLLIPICFSHAGVKDIPKGVVNVTKKIIDTSWMEDSLLKYGLISSVVIAQAMTGLVESHKFNGNYLINDSNYHVYRYLQDVSFLTSGWMMSATIRNKKLSWVTKTRRIAGTILLARNSYEWFYKANRWGTPFDYDPAHSNNEKAIVYIKIDFSNWTLSDGYISGTGSQGILIDLTCLALGIILLK